MSLLRVTGVRHDSVTPDISHALKDCRRRLTFGNPGLGFGATEAH